MIVLRAYVNGFVFTSEEMSESVQDMQEFIKTHIKGDANYIKFTNEDGRVVLLGSAACSAAVFTIQEVEE